MPTPSPLPLPLGQRGQKSRAGRCAVLLARWIVQSVPFRNCQLQWTQEGTHARKTGSGATRKTTRREVRRIVRHLAEANLKSSAPFRALSLTPEHRQLPLQWCHARSMWNVTDWQNVVFSDESRFVLGTDDNRVWVWRHPDERYNYPALFYVTLPAQLV
ncbi:HTH_Tnp_Tc3_2 domain-containing protein [Trichonephila clavipes]|nr:HTH_Tnp_Tc3_2 domain-containing protein [Trichonephila clavipes]